MPDPTPRPPQSRWHYLTAVGVVVFLVAVLITLLKPMYGLIVDRSDMQKAVNNCRQIVISCMLYSNDQAGTFPDDPGHDEHPKTANEAFRELFKSGVCHEERIFGCPQSPFVPDGEIGQAPKWVKALERGENHWAMTAGLEASSAGPFPLIFENPAEYSLPPRWNADAAGRKIPGRCWRGGKVIVGCVDGSVTLLPLESTKGTRVALRPRQGSSPADDPMLFQQGHGVDGPALKILPVEQ